MSIPRFIQIHSLHSYSTALLNRDDSGLAKRIPYGGVVRTRISSQCLKRHWRTAQDMFSLHNIPGATEAIRSRNIIERMVMVPSQLQGNISPEVLQVVAEEFNIGLYGSSGKEEKNRQPLLLGLPEIEHLQEKATEIATLFHDNPEEAKEQSKALFNLSRPEGQNFRAFINSAKVPYSIEGALFGRMITSDPGANIDAAIHVAHAFTVHQQETESDYFSVVDDLTREDEHAGAAHIGNVEINAGLFYGYVVVDVPGLVSNLEGCKASEWETTDKELSAKIVEHLLHLIATITPGAKLGSTAPYTYADMLLVEAGNRQPRSLAPAYRTPTEPQLEEAVRTLSTHLNNLDDVYGAHEDRRLMSVNGLAIDNVDKLSLLSIGEWTANAIRNGQTE